MKTEPVIKFEALAFDIGDVKLLPGPFKHAEDMGHKYLLALDPDRLLAPFYEAADLKSKKLRYGGWESSQLSGHILGHWLSAASRMTALTGDGKLKKRIDYVITELAALQSKNPDGYICGFPEDPFKAAFSGNFDVTSWSLNGHWAPWYTMHKILAGLLDAYEICGNEQALAIAKKLGDWAKAGTDKLTYEQFQKMLQCEFGGMSDSLAELYAVTGYQKYLELAKSFTHHIILDPLSKSQDNLAGLHANTQIPKLIGAARIYELTGDEFYKKAALYFWDEVTSKRSYVFGGNSKEEHFQILGGEPLGKKTAESCNSHNMLKLTKRMMLWQEDPHYADYYELVLYNHILASQDPDTGMMLYFLSTKPGHFKVYNTPFNSMWCCTGTGMESTARYTESIYMHNEKTIWVNLYVPSVLDWNEKGLILTQETAFPQEPKAKLIITRAPIGNLEIRLRVPSWAAGPVVVKINGTEEQSSADNKKWIVLSRIWKNGDIIEVSLPMKLWLYRSQDDASKVALLYGPIVLAGEMGKDNFPPSDQSEDPSGPAGYSSKGAPLLVTAENNLSKWIKPVKLKDLTFRTFGVGKPEEISLIPLYKIRHQKYTIYFHMISPAEWEKDEKKFLDGMARWPLSPSATKPSGTIYEAENASLSGEAVMASDHDDFSGMGFVVGYYQGFNQKTAFTVKAPVQGKYTVIVRYANNMGSEQTLSLYVNEKFYQKVKFKNMEDWDTWGNASITCDLKKGDNSVSFVKNKGDGCVNLDYLAVQ